MTEAIETRPTAADIATDVELCGRVTALAIAALVVGGLFVTAEEGPLPALPWASAFLLLAVDQDLRHLRIPNWLTLPALLLAMGLGAVNAGWSGFATAALGATIAFAVLFIPFAMRWMGAGDVKAAMVLAALWGADLFLPVLWWMVVMGGLIAIALIAARGGFLDLLRRWSQSLQASVGSRRPTYFGPEAGTTAAGGLPFAVAMGLGAISFQLWGIPWF